MGGNGWQFSVTIPSWTQATLEGDENVVFYRVEVKVLPPEADAAPRTRSVLRRFSHFTKLWAKLKEELGNRKMARLDPPSKNRLVGVNKRPDLVEKRRRELESWLWKLIGDGEIARSRVLNNFLELSDAARLVQRAAPAAVPSRPPSQAGSYTWSEGGSSSMQEGSSQQSSAAPSAADPYIAGLDALPSVRPSVTQIQRSASDSGSHLTGAPLGPPSNPHTALPPMARSASTSAGTSIASGPHSHQQTVEAQQPMSRTTSTASEQPVHREAAASVRAVSESGAVTQGPEPRMRLGLRVEQRVTVKHHVKALQQQLDRAAGDLQDAMEAIQTERHTKRQLAAQLADLQDRASENGVTQAAAREAELTTSLEHAHESRTQLQQQMTEAEAQIAVAHSQLDDSKSAYAELQQQLSASQESVTKLQSQLSHANQVLTQSQETAAAAHQESQSAAASSMSQELHNSQQHASSLQAQLVQVQEQLAQSQHAAAQAESSHQDSRTAAATDAQQKLQASQQKVNQLQSEVDRLQQQLLQSQEAARGEAEHREHASAREDETAATPSLLDDAPTVAPPSNTGLDSSGQDTAEAPLAAESVISLQADKAAADDRLAALLAEMQSSRQEAADAEAKSRADRKLLAREIKALRKQLDTEKQQAAAKEAEHPAREAEHAAKEAEHAAALQAEHTAREAEHTARQAEQKAWEVERAAAAAARSAAADSLEHTAVQDSEATAATAASSAVTAPDEQEAAKAADVAAAASARPDADVASLPVPNEEAADARPDSADESSQTPAPEAVADSASASAAPAAAASSYKQLLQEVGALRQRLHDSSFEVVAGQSGAGYDIKPRAAMEMLSTCDGRLQALMAEANFLGEAAASEGQISEDDAELRQAFASVLIESGALRQQINTLLRDKYETEAHSQELQSQPATASDAKGLFRKLPAMPFLAPQSNGNANHATEDTTKPAFGQGIGDRFAGLGDRFSKSFGRPQQ